MGKHQSGSSKRKRKEREHNLIDESYKGGMDRFVTKEAPQVSFDNQSVDSSTLALAVVPHNDVEDFISKNTKRMMLFK